MLRLGPKFCEYVNLDEEKFEIEIEQAILKYKWETMSDEKGEDEKPRDLSDIARKVLIRELYTTEEIEEMNEDEEEAMRMRDAELRQVFDMRTGTIDMRKRRVTDIKGNSRVILPKKMRGFDEEAKLEVLRQETRGVVGQYMRENCGPNGVQKTNLTRGEVRGLRSLRKRIKEGELVVLPTDKTGLFAVMSRSTYTECGMKHVKGYTEVGWDDLKVAQSELNGHTSMMIKIFGIGEAWNHTSRVRETMLGESMTTCPLTLQYKDHKGWTREMGTIPPTRPVVGGPLGMNLYLSEIVSDLVEPLVDRYKGGKENISSEDLIARLVQLNSSNKEWTSWSWWEGATCEDYVGCGHCQGVWDLEFSREEPELCSCTRA